MKKHALQFPVENFSAGCFLTSTDPSLVCSESTTIINVNFPSVYPQN
uniref:Uncharacterized protein n=1 Tax=Arundo donax TaxID=35708 RepID=A0A0A9GRG3_ARUDO